METDGQMAPAVHHFWHHLLHRRQRRLYLQRIFHFRLGGLHLLDPCASAFSPFSPCALTAWLRMVFQGHHYRPAGHG